MIGNFVGAPVGGAITSGAVGNTGVLAVTLDDIAFSASGALAIAGQVTTALDDAILVAAGALALSGAAAIVLDDAILLATGELSIHGWEGTLLDDVEIKATGIFEFINITIPTGRLGLITTAMPRNTNITTSRSLPRQITS